MLDFEKLGAFYLGKRFDGDADALTDELVLYDSKDLTTHAVIIGMTGSGKTGLGIGILEEAALDHIPVIAIDPKGDIGNLLLTFPKLRGEDFRPWINARTASDKGQSADEYAADQAALWKNGIVEWGQDGERIAALRAKSDLAIYTPGSTAGRPISVLQSFVAPDAALVADGDLYRERLQATATGLLTLLGIDADPLASREHILLTSLLDHAWQAGRDMDISKLIAGIQNPPMQKLGVMSIDDFFPGKERFALAMKLNGLLAAPGFDAWMQGEALKAKNLLYTEAGKPRISILSIAHLDDAERMFFVTLLLSELIGWMRAQSGTSSLRAILYMDEIFGYLPPVANPPSKELFLTLLKQARAYGLGLVLATQNPVDLDYKGLSNTGTWFIGRLQTERDKARVMEGLEGASGGKFDKAAMERTLAGLGKRRFLLHNVHEDQAVVFETRWVLSYLAGPLTREQIKQLVVKEDSETVSTAPEVPRSPDTAGAAPALSPDIQQYFLPAGNDAPVYQPQVIAAGELLYTSARYKLEERRSVFYAVDFCEGPVSLDWDNAASLPHPLADIAEQSISGASFADCPDAAIDAKNYPAWERDFKRWLRQNVTLVLFHSKRFRLTSEPRETEGDFRVRLQNLASEQRDEAVAKLRKRYAGKLTTLENRLLRAEQAIEREQAQSSKSKLDTAVSISSAILGAVLGRKKLSSGTANKIGSAMKRAGTASKEAADVARAEETRDKVRADIESINADLAEEIENLDTHFDAQEEPLEEIVIRATSTNISVPLFGLGWVPV
jgi:hypothetical protein